MNLRNTPDGKQPQSELSLARVFRVTSRDVDEYVQLILAKDRVDATASAGQVVSNLDRRTYHEVVECVELQEQS